MAMLRAISVLVVLLLAAPGMALAQTALKGVIGTASLGGDMYTLGVNLGKIAADKVPGVSLTVRTTGGGTENMRLLGSKQVEFGLVMGPEAGLAMKGLAPFEGKAADFQNLRGMVAFPYGGIQVVVLGSSSIRTIADLKGKKVAVGAPGSSGAMLFVPALLTSHGITKDNTSWVYLNARGAVDGLKNRQIDALAFLQEPPIVHIANLAVTEKIRLVAGDRAAVDKATAALGGTYPVDVPKDVYGASQVNEGPIVTLGAAMVLATREDVSAEVVYTVLKAFWGELDKYRAGGILEKRIHLKAALQGITLPLHPGAERFYREAGLLKDGRSAGK
jgi:TRAP transporter TAXI family solute receptor